MKKIKILLLCSLSMMACSQEESRQDLLKNSNKKTENKWSATATVKELKLFQINVWQEGTSVTGGYDAIVNEIVRSDADFVFLSEVRNYNNVDFTNKLVQSLHSKGYTYYSFRSDDSGILSRYPIIENASVYPVSNDHGSVYKLVTQINGQRIAAYTSHLDYTHYACYLPRGYSGTTWSKLPNGPETNLTKISEMNLASYRDEAISAFISDANTEKTKGSIVFLGGDFNEPSMFDWVSSTANLYDHHTVVYEWDTTKLLNNAGFKDSYRMMHPSPVTHPGFTYPSDNPAKPVNQLTWAPDADERERIDYIFFMQAPNLTLKSSHIIGYNKSIVKNIRTPENTQDSFVPPIGIWPSDHKGVLSTFELVTQNGTSNR
ncbi:endonuclease/exonuclease/phosphatase family protein [Chryseobacterium proteolyticum]|uniref:endonuclease/exonuclease/phosphatase family protein n=1 Tax=Chryseobacterium proteolyticum TaxID=118127 RepID=UPI00398376F9